MRPLVSTGRKRSIQSVDRAAAILNALASGPRRLGVSELAARLGLAKPTVHGLLQTLQTHGFVEQHTGTEKYQLGAGLLQLGFSYLDLNELRFRSIPYADRLATRTGCAVRLGVMHGAAVVVIHHLFRPNSSFQIPEVGLRLPLHATSFGKALLAYMPASVLDDLCAEPLAQLTKRTLVAGKLRAALAKVRSEGLATEHDEAVLGESSVAAPVFDHTGKVVGAIGAVGDSEHIFPDDLAPGLAAAVKEAARGISRELGANRWPNEAERGA